MFEFFFKYSRADYARGELVLLSEWPAWLTFGVPFIAAIGLASLLYIRRGNASIGQLFGIACLQVAFIALVVWVVREPSLATERLRDGENSVALILDNSASMAYGDGESRLQVATRSLAAAFADTDDSGVALRLYGLMDNAERVDSFVDMQADGDSTNIAAALLNVLDAASSDPLAAVVLASDGADTGGGLTASELDEISAFGVPVHTIGVGQSRITSDLELRHVSLPATALPGSTVSARVTVRHDDAAATQLKVYDGDNLLQIVPVELAADVGQSIVWVEVEVQDAGPHSLQFSLDPIGGEQEVRNNTRTALVDVQDQQFSVLYFEGEPRWEYKFLRRAVADDADIALMTLLRVSPNKFYRQGISTPEQLAEGFPSTAAELFAFDALIIGSVEAASLDKEQQQLIKKFVGERGGSLLLIAGPNGLGNGGWGQSAIADVLPTRLPAPGDDSFQRRKVSVALTPHGEAMPMLRLAADGDENRAAWSALPQIADFQLTGELKPAAITLLEFESGTGARPLLITQPYGRGNAFILATGGTWRWQMSMPADDQSHEAFWRQTLRALVSSAPAAVSLQVSADGDTALSLRAEFRDEEFNTLDDIGVSAVASNANGDAMSIVLQPSNSEAGVFLGEVEPGTSGTWYVEALAERSGEPLAVARSSVHFQAGDAEHFNFRANNALLQRISNVTGGQNFAPEQAGDIGELLRYSSAGVTETEYRRIWDAPAILMLLLLLKGAEWLLRRRWGSI